MSLIHQKTLNRLQQLMLEHDFCLEYTAGDEHVVPDFLSRNVVGAVEATGVDIRQLQRDDADIADVAHIIRTGEPARKKLGVARRQVLEKIAGDCDIRDGVVWYTTDRPCLLYTSPSPRDRG